MNRASSFALIAVSLMFAAHLIAAGTPIAKRNPGDYARSMGQAETVLTSITAGSSECLKAGPGSANCAVFGYGTVTTVQMGSAGTCCWSQDPTLSLGAQSAETATALGGSTRGCAGKTFLVAGAEHDMIPETSVLTAHDVGVTGMVCSNQVTDVHGSSSYPGCESSDNADCTALGAGACSRATNDSDGAAYLICDVATTGFVAYTAER